MVTENLITPLSERLSDVPGAMEPLVDSIYGLTLVMNHLRLPKRTKALLNNNVKADIECKR